MTTAAQFRALVQRDLKDESAVRWTADEIDRALAKALDDYSQAYPAVTYKDAAKVADSDTLDVHGESGYIYALWIESQLGTARRRRSASVRSGGATCGSRRALCR